MKDCGGPGQGPVPPVASLQATRVVAPHSPVNSEMTVSKSLPQVSMVRGPGQAPVVMRNQTSGAAEPAAQSAGPSAVAPHMEPVKVPPLRALVAAEQVLLEGVEEAVKTKWMIKLPW